MTKKFFFYKADDTLPSEPVEDVVINIDMKLGEVRDYEKARQFYQQEAHELCEVLFSVLPGGTFDQLTAAMLLKKASLFRVTHRKD